ncbi:HAMP domain-containing sensor histidine kinase [uncultured Stenotrophomonas sp.]|uniref:sensor histidine kinase n=1 Tax=uncultured Stenotrophomonas sp. TaxID=165438 RepID=UPI0028EABA73|nr:HAMP domain-containing sensor histidine kinase [uncultured Stenotrophomonas sp.]
MSEPSRPRRRLRHRLMLAFSGFALLVAVIYGFYVVLFVYLVEDQLFNGLLEQEATVQLQHHASRGEWRQPALPGMNVYSDPSTLPDGIAAKLSEEPWRREFAGDQGRHYHLHLLEPGGGVTPAWLAAEVSQQLVVRPMRNGILQWLAWSSLAVLVAAVLLGAWLARRMTGPLSRLSAMVEQASPSRLPQGFAESLPDDEVGVLARTLQHLLGRVDEFVGREREFTRDASHELRTPLAVIRSACERIGARTDLDEPLQRQVQYIDSSVQQLEQTVSALLMLAREQHQQEAPTETALLPLLERVIVDQSSVLANRPVEVALEVGSNVHAHLPPAALRIILSNLVGNAFAHTLNGTVDLSVADGWLVISNPGAAISPDDLHAFIKSDASRGYGLGLAIVQRLCERHGIGLRMHSEHGTTTVALLLDGRLRAPCIPPAP